MLTSHSKVCVLIFMAAFAGFSHSLASEGHSLFVQVLSPQGEPIALVISCNTDIVLLVHLASGPVRSSGLRVKNESGSTLIPCHHACAKLCDLGQVFLSFPILSLSNGNDKPFMRILQGGNRKCFVDCHGEEAHSGLGFGALIFCLLENVSGLRVEFSDRAYA